MGNLKKESKDDQARVLVEEEWTPLFGKDDIRHGLVFPKKRTIMSCLPSFSTPINGSSGGTLACDCANNSQQGPLFFIVLWRNPLSCGWWAVRTCRRGPFWDEWLVLLVSSGHARG